MVLDDYNPVHVPMSGLARTSALDLWWAVIKGLETACMMITGWSWERATSVCGVVRFLLVIQCNLFLWQPLVASCVLGRLCGASCVFFAIIRSLGLPWAAASVICTILYFAVKRRATFNEAVADIEHNCRSKMPITVNGDQTHTKEILIHPKELTHIGSFHNQEEE